MKKLCALLKHICLAEGLKLWHLKEFAFRSQLRLLFITSVFSINENDNEYFR